MNDLSFRIGPIRPPSEADSLLLQVTRGCTWNKCRFCELYKGTRFMTYSADSIKADIDKIAALAEIVEKYKIVKHSNLSGLNLVGGSKSEIQAKKCDSNVDQEISDDNLNQKKRVPEIDWDINGINHELNKTSNGEERQSLYMVANWLIHGGHNVFLQDGNTTVLRDGRLSEVLIYLKKTFPSINRITSYGRAENLSRVSVEEFAELKEAGLDRIHSGFETGSDEVLKYINKGLTQAQEITAGKNIKKGGIELSIYFMPGVGGRPLSESNAKETAYVVNEVNPDFLRIRTFTAKEGTALYDEWLRGAALTENEIEKLVADAKSNSVAKISDEQVCGAEEAISRQEDLRALNEQRADLNDLQKLQNNGILISCSDEEKLLEIRKVIEMAEGVDTVIVSDHIVNLLQNVEGSLVKDKKILLSKIDEFLNLSPADKKEFQLARRLGLVMEPKDVRHLDPMAKREIEQSIRRIPENEWEMRMNLLMERYV